MPDALTLQNRPFRCIVVEEKAKLPLPCACRHCDDAICVKSCIAGALSKQADGTVLVDEKKCVGCHTCVLVCPFGAIRLDEGKPSKSATFVLKRAAHPLAYSTVPTAP